MPTVLKIGGFRFIIWPADHEPPHVHAFKGGGEAKITLGDKECRPSFVTIAGLTKPDARKAWEIVAEHQKVLLKAWEKIHGNLDN